MTKTNFFKVYSTPSCEEIAINAESALLGLSNGNPDPDVVNDSDSWK